MTLTLGKESQGFDAPCGTSKTGLDFFWAGGLHGKFAINHQTRFLLSLLQQPNPPPSTIPHLSLGPLPFSLHCLMSLHYDS
jgi:hypothetical protein